MENREQQILSEIKEMMASIRIQLEKLDDKMAELQQVVDPEGVAAMPIDIEISDEHLVEEPQVVVVQEIPLEMDEPVSAIEEPVAEEPAVVETVVEEPVVEEVAVQETVVEETPVVEVEEDLPVAVEENLPVAEEDDDDDLPLFAEPTPLFEAAQASPKAKKAVLDVMEDKQAWRTDMPGAPVRDLLSAISLNDRVQFINTLFNGDPAIFQQTRAKINMMTSLDQVLEFITANFNWDLNSQVVYRFMMAVRRKIQ
ncbi:MAG: hypothetical protein IKZ08_00630 [Bacteroidales bacterium]|nr:hypothetical protein [Bacteroidales bacterium]